MNHHHIEARLAEPGYGLAIGDSGALPDEIQWMPPGKHTIHATKNGKPVVETVVVDATAAELLQAQLQERRMAAADGAGDLPFLDFNHEDRDAAGRVLAIRWAGDDPKSGGIRAKIEWTKPGQEALAGKSFRRFSPSFTVNAQGRVSGAPINMGGLVNRAAFKTIQPIVAQGSAMATDGNAKERNPMDPDKLAADLAAANSRIADLERQLTQAKADDAVKAKDAEILRLTTKVAQLEGNLVTQAKANAKSVVDAAVTAGKLPPKADALHAKWVDAITANPDLAETLNAMQPNAALQTVVGNGNPASAGDCGTIQAKAEDEIAAFKVAHPGTSYVEARNAVRINKPELFGVK